jgi:hypothetical protein
MHWLVLATAAIAVILIDNDISTATVPSGTGGDLTAGRGRV